MICGFGSHDCPHNSLTENPFSRSQSKRSHRRQHNAQVPKEQSKTISRSTPRVVEETTFAQIVFKLKCQRLVAHANFDSESSIKSFFELKNSPSSVQSTATRCCFATL